ncbi:putative mediator of RNA polymerase II transcription subunit 29 [Schistocerca americana]|uniref:putative mediator of RNA polymerase II transcription subunit 29 n=1 Tax=Schistocerca americana TaxID=7009 RepID=UPI001F4F99D0|nr:putative mediator of RNA polymerase II transcription subunit 29 [Schistocerca americana]
MENINNILLERDKEIVRRINQVLVDRDNAITTHFKQEIDAVKTTIEPLKNIPVQANSLETEVDRLENQFKALATAVETMQEDIPSEVRTEVARVLSSENQNFENLTVCSNDNTGTDRQKIADNLTANINAPQGRPNFDTDLKEFLSVIDSLDLVQEDARKNSDVINNNNSPNRKNSWNGNNGNRGEGSPKKKIKLIAEEHQQPNGNQRPYHNENPNNNNSNRKRRNDNRSDSPYKDKPKNMRGDSEYWRQPGPSHWQPQQNSINSGQPINYVQAIPIPSNQYPPWWGPSRPPPTENSQNVRIVEVPSETKQNTQKPTN